MASRSDSSDPPMLPKSLVYVSDTMPGIARRKKGKGFAYYDPDGCHIADAQQLARISGLGIPPAYREVWICPTPYGHIQATGLDDACRKQYRYHDLWSQFRAEAKFSSLAAFGRELPRIRRAVRRNLKRARPDRDLAIAALVRLIDDSGIRIGSRRRSAAIGATGLRHRHVSLEKDSITLNFIAKGGKKSRIELADRTLLKVLHDIDDLPGRHLFQYIGDDDALHPIDSSQVNDWLRALSPKSQATAKTFRTWMGSVAAFKTACQADDLTIKAMTEAAAEQLRNTPAICRSSYVHPAVLALADMAKQERCEAIKDAPPGPHGLRKAERGLLAYLESRA